MEVAGAAEAEASEAGLQWWNAGRRLRARREFGQHGACEKGGLEPKVGDGLIRQNTRPAWRRNYSARHWGAVNVSKEPHSDLCFGRTTLWGSAAGLDGGKRQKKLQSCVLPSPG